MQYLRQGMLAVGELLVAFTVLTDDRKDKMLGEAMEALKSASHALK